MMTTTYNIQARYRADTRGAQSELDRLARSTDNVAGRAQIARRHLLGLGVAVKAALAGAGAIAFGGLAQKMGSLAMAAEDARIVIGSVFQTLSGDVGNFNQHLERAEGLAKRFHVAAITSPATSAEFRSVFRGAAPALAGLGATDDDIVEIISRSVPAAMAFMGGNYDQMGTDMARILSGQAGMQTRLFVPLQEQLLKHTETSSTEEFNRLAQQDPRKVFDALNTVLSSMDEANVAFSESFGGAYAALMGHINNILQTIGEPVFNRIRDRLNTLVTWLNNNQDLVARMAETIGGRLGAAFDKATRAAEFLRTNVDAIVTGLGLMAAWSGRKLAANLAMATLAQGRTASGRIGAMGRQGAGSVISGGLSMVGDLLYGDILGPRRSSRTGGALRRAPRAAAGVAMALPGMAAAGLKALPAVALAGLKALTAGLASLGVVLAPLAVIVGMVAGTFRVFRDSTNEVTIFFRTAVNDLMIQLGSLGAMFGLSGGGFGEKLKTFADFLGGGVVGTLGLLVAGIAKLVEGLDWLLTSISAIGSGISNMVKQWQDAGGGIAGLRSVDAGEAFGTAWEAAHDDRRQRQIASMARREQQRRERERQKEEDAKADEEARKGGAPQVTMNVTINNNVRRETNPDRIAYKSNELLMDAIENNRLSVHRPRRS